MAILAAFTLPITTVLIPEVGRGRERDAVRTLAACRRVARTVAALGPDVLVLITPGSGDRPVLWRPVTDTMLRDYTFVHAPELNRRDRIDGALTATLADAAGRAWNEQRSDHAPAAALAPLYFVAPGEIAICVIEVPTANLGVAREVGRAVARAVPALRRQAVVIAAGELSSKLFRGAPGGYDPGAREFDALVVDGVRAGDPEALPRRLDSPLRTAVGESLAGPLTAALAALGSGARAELLSYESPFGVGYIVVHLDQGYRPL